VRCAALAVLCLLTAARAYGIGTTVDLSSFAATDNQSTNPEIFGCAEHYAGSATDASIGASQTVTYSTTNGGSDTLRWSLKSTVAAGSGNKAYCTRDSTSPGLLNSLTQGAVRRNINFDTLPGAGTRRGAPLTRREAWCSTSRSRWWCSWT
jgi:hypothetical protein